MSFLIKFSKIPVTAYPNSIQNTGQRSNLRAIFSNYSLQVTDFRITVATLYLVFDLSRRSSHNKLSVHLYQEILEFFFHSTTGVPLSIFFLIPNLATLGLLDSHLVPLSIKL